MNKNKYLRISTMRRELLVAGASLPALAWAGAVRAQAKPAKIARIGILHSASESGTEMQVKSLREGLRDLGYVEGKNIAFEFRWADGNYERLNEFAAELVRLKVDIIVTAGTPSARAAKQASTTIPIVMAVIGDAVAAGLVTSLARPDGNITGSSIFSSEIHIKRLELLKETVPRISRVAVLINRGNPALVTNLKEVESAAKLLKLALQQFDVRGPGEFDSAFLEMNKQRIDAVLVLDDPMLNVNIKSSADFAAKRRLPSAGNTALAEAGGLIGYGIIRGESWRRAATYIDKILKGAKPADLPIERATTFDLVINGRTAKALGITIPQSVLVRAARVIE